MKTICEDAIKIVVKSKDIFTDILKLIPSGEYFRYYVFWNQKLSQLIGYLALSYWLLNKELIKIEKVKELLGIDVPIEEYLHGVTYISSELSRLTINLVIKGDYKTPVLIDQFLKDFYQGMKLFNLKNDSLRKKFDGIKYDIKKVEQVVYDLSMNKLN